MRTYHKFEYSKAKAIKASQQLVDNKLTFEDKINCIAIVANFRSAHDYPMQSMIAYFRKKAFAIDKKAIVVRRLKRIPSIISKLKRFPKMKIATMGDIGGIRIITKDLNTVIKIRDSLVKGKTHNKRLSEKNYLTQVKESGYRGIHLMYSYQGAKQDYVGFRVELQIRSHIQHAWATAVEVAGTFLEENLKAGYGDKKWLDFFQTVSFAFACLEEKKAIETTLKNKLAKQIRDLNIFDKLASFSLITKHSEEKKGFYLIQLDIEDKAVSVQHYIPSFLTEAISEYRRIEQEISEDITKDVVLVSAQSLKELKKAYPNYFADTQLFIKKLHEIIK